MSVEGEGGRVALGGLVMSVTIEGGARGVVIVIIVVRFL